MTQIFLVGSSSIYGVGGTFGGFGDLIKHALHKKMYEAGGFGEQFEVFNFGKSGAKIEFVKTSFPKYLSDYGRGGKIITIVSIGGNNSKAENQPDNFVSSFEDYETQMVDLMDLLQTHSTHVIAVGSGFVDESKTNPKHNPLTGKRSYFTNKRRQQFEKRWQAICVENNIPFVGVELSESEWLTEYLYIDGLHPNDKGHQYICDNVLRILVTKL